MTPVAVVTDSTAVLAGRGSVTTVPLQVVVDGVSHTDGTLAPGLLAQSMRRRSPVSTSRPTPHVFLEAYERLVEQGADAIVSVHLSSALSGTVDAAASAAVDSPVPVRVVDTQTIARPLGVAAEEAAVLAAAGADLDACEAAARRVTAASEVVVYVDTLEHLRRGGRIGGSQALLGSALAIKPILEVRDGAVQPLERVRTAGRALGRLEAICLERAGRIRASGATLDVAVHHLDADERAQTLCDHLAASLEEQPRVVELGAVIGAHVGPGTIAVTLAPRFES